MSRGYNCFANCELDGVDQPESEILVVCACATSLLILHSLALYFHICGQ